MKIWICHLICVRRNRSVSIVNRSNFIFTFKPHVFRYFLRDIFRNPIIVVYNHYLSTPTHSVLFFSLTHSSSPKLNLPHFQQWRPWPQPSLPPFPKPNSSTTNPLSMAPPWPHAPPSQSNPHPTTSQLPCPPLLTISIASNSNQLKNPSSPAR